MARVVTYLFETGHKSIAVKKIAGVEAKRGIADAPQFTVPRAPSVKARSSATTK